jgi:hypothetical protein
MNRPSNPFNLSPETMNPAQKEIMMKWLGPTGNATAAKFAMSGPPAVGTTEMANYNKNISSMQDFVMEMARAAKTWDPFDIAKKIQMMQQPNQGLPSSTTTAGGKGTAGAPLPTGNTRSDIERTNGARSTNDLRRSSFGLESLRRVPDMGAANSPSALASASSGTTKQTTTTPTAPAASVPVTAATTVPGAFSATVPPTTQGSMGSTVMPSRPNPQPSSSAPKQFNNSSTSLKDSNPLRGGKSNPLRGGKSNPLRGGKSNPLRDGKSNPLRGGKSNPYRNR